jgi:adenylosuccinate synthase
MQSIIVLTGPVASGKSTLAERLEERFAATRLSTRALLLARMPEGAPRDRAGLQNFGDQLDAETGGRWLADAVWQAAGTLSDDALIVIDSPRLPAQIEALRQTFPRRVVHVHLTAPLPILAERYETRPSEVAELASYGAVRENATEAAIGELAAQADVVIDTARATEADVFARAVSHLGLTAREPERLVDVLIGGAYGSEGKGHLAYHLAPEYDVLVRVGGPNAGHNVIPDGGTPFTHRSLPSGTLAGQARLFIGAGAVLNVDRGDKNLLQEIAVEAELELKKTIGSTGQGGGAATARRISRTADVVLAGDVRALKPYTQRPVVDLLEEAYARGERIMLEGTQGTGLSLYHGSYPHVTSRDTTVSGCLAESGIAPGRVRKVVMVCRTYPIRVMDPEKHTSGPMSREVTWDEIAARSGIPVESLKEAEVGSVTKNPRRVGEFDWDQLRRASVLNAPTDIALTFADYLSIENRKARRFEQLTEETIHFIAEVERVAAARVSLIGVDFHPRSIIDRRLW